MFLSESSADFSIAADWRIYQSPKRYLDTEHMEKKHTHADRQCFHGDCRPYAIVKRTADETFKMEWIE
jgi:hypothetical protein